MICKTTSNEYSKTHRHKSLLISKENKINIFEHNSKLKYLSKHHNKVTS